MEILTGTEMRQVDRRAIEEAGIPSQSLMESAGRGVAHALATDYRESLQRGAIVLSGKGNNGGDGFVAARHLAAAGFPVRVLAFARDEEVRGDAAAALAGARAAGVPVTTIEHDAEWGVARAAVAQAGVVVDALLGTGIRGAVRGLLARVIEDLNGASVPVVAVDVPSGVDADRAEVQGPVVRAATTYALCRPKPPLVLEPAARFAGRWRVVPIGIPDSIVASAGSTLEWIDRDAVRGLVPRRAVDSHKGDHGHLLAIAGSAGRGGAAVLLARAALRTGAGLVTVATPRGERPVVAAQQAEVMTEPLPETRRGAIGRAASRVALRLVADRGALAIGPGLGASAETRAAVLEILRRARRPTVVDADALNAVARSGSNGLERLRGAADRLVLTPHPGEAARLLGRSSGEIQQDRLAAAREIARRSQAITVLKGHRTIIASPDGHASINASGNPGLATAGTGDVLTGVVGALLARGLAPRDAARVAVFLHGDAGDRAASAIGGDGLLASDVIDRLPEALAALAASAEG